MAEIDAALANDITYTPTSGFSGTDALILSAADGAIASNTATVNIDVTPSGPTVDNWTGGGDGSTWTDPNNWSAGEPGSNSEAFITVTGTTVTYNTDDTIYSLTTAGGTSGTTLNVTAGTLTITSSEQMLGTVNNSGVLDLANGTLNLATNSGLVEVTGGTLFLEGDINNSDGSNGNIAAYDGSTLQLAANVTITGGDVTIGTASDTTDALLIGGGGNATLDGVAAANYGTITVDSGALLTLEDNMTVTGGQLIVGNSATVYIEKSVTSSTATVTLSGVNVTLQNSSTIHVDISGGPTSAATVDLALTGGSVVNGGTLSIGGAGEVEIGSGGATFDGGLTVSNQGSISVTSGTLTLAGATVEGGTITNNGTIEVNANSTIDGGAAVNGGTVTVDSGATLTFGNGSLDSGTLNNVSVTDHGAITIASGETLTIGGSSNTITSGSSATSTIDNSGTFALANSATVTLSGVQIGGNITVGINATLTVGTASSGNATGATFDGGTVTNNGTIAVSSATLTLVGDDRRRLDRQLWHDHYRWRHDHR